MEKNKLPQWYISSRKILNSNLVPENYKGVVAKHPSPNGQCNLVIEKYQKTKDDWINDYFRGIIYCKDKEVAVLQSNAQYFWHCWIQQNDKLYLICNECEQGYTIVDITNGDIISYIDPRANQGSGFAWKGTIPSNDGRHLAVWGEYPFIGIKEAVLFEFTPKVPLKRVKSSMLTEQEDGSTIIKNMVNIG